MQNQARRLHSSGAAREIRHTAYPRRSAGICRLIRAGRFRSAWALSGVACSSVFSRGKKQKGRPRRPPRCSTIEVRSMGAVRHGFGAVAPDVDADEKEQPHHVDEMPVPRGEFEAEMLGRAEMPGIGTEQTDDQEYGSNQHMEAVEPGRHEEGRAVDIASK